MFDRVFDNAVLRNDLEPIFRKTWDALASAGTHWTGAQRVSIAAMARDARAGRPIGSDDIAETAMVAAATLAAAPSEVHREWVETAVHELGEGPYVELAGIVASVMGVDVLMALGGCELAPLPVPIPGDPSGYEPVRGLKKRSSWVSMAGPPLPRFSLSAVPAAQRMMNRLLNRLYVDMADDEARTATEVRGLTRVQMELVSLVVSHSNECFYCTLSHIVSLRSSAHKTETQIDFAGIVDPRIDTGIVGGRELIGLARSATLPEPDAAATYAVVEVLGTEAAATAIEVAGAFEMTNRVVEATGQPVLRKERERAMPILEALGALSFPHSGLQTDRLRSKSERFAHRAKRKIKRL